MINVSWILSLFLVNSPLAVYVSPGCFKSIFNINLSSVNKNLFFISVILYFSNKRGPSVKGLLIPKLLNNLLACCSLINIDFLLLHFAHFYKSINLPLLVIYKYWIFTFSFFFYTPEIRWNCFQYILNIYVIKFFRHN